MLSSALLTTPYILVNEIIKILHCTKKKCNTIVPITVRILIFAVFVQLLKGYLEMFKFIVNFLRESDVWSWLNKFKFIKKKLVAIEIIQKFAGRK